MSRRPPPRLSERAVRVNCYEVVEPEGGRPGGFSTLRHRVHARALQALTEGWRAWPGSQAPRATPPFLVYHFDGNDNGSDVAAAAIDCERVMRSTLDGTMLAFGLEGALAHSSTAHAAGWCQRGGARDTRLVRASDVDGARRLTLFAFSWHADDAGWVATTLERVLATEAAGCAVAELLRDCFIAAAPVVRGDAGGPGPSAAAVADGNGETVDVNGEAADVNGEAADVNGEAAVTGTGPPGVAAVADGNDADGFEPAKRTRRSRRGGVRHRARGGGGGG